MVPSRASASWSAVRLVKVFRRHLIAQGPPPGWHVGVSSAAAGRGAAKKSGAHIQTHNAPSWRRATHDTKTKSRHTHVAFMQYLPAGV